MKKIMLVLLLALSFSAISQTRIISGVGETPAGIQHARSYVYFHYALFEYTNYEITITSELSGVIYNLGMVWTREFNFTYQLTSTDTYYIEFDCYNFVTQNRYVYEMVIEYEE